MAVPVFISISPSAALTMGGEILVLKGAGLSARLRVSFSGAPSPQIVGVTSDGSEAWIRSPGGSPGLADVLIENLDEAGDPIVGESALEEGAITFALPDLSEGSPLEALTRALLREISRFLPKGAADPDSFAVDYDDDPEDGLRVLHFAQLPGLALSGPRLAPNLFYRQVFRRYETIPELPGKLRIRGPSLTYDAIYAISVASESRVQALNLCNTVAGSLHRRPKISTLDQAGPWNLSLSEIRFSPPRDGVHVASFEIRIVGFNLDEGFELGRAIEVEETEVSIQ